MQQIKKIWRSRIDIFYGFANLILCKLRILNDEQVEKFEKKNSICNVSCPLMGKRLVFDVCDDTKNVGDTWGCGCFATAKKFSDSKCPMGKF